MGFSDHLRHFKSRLLRTNIFSGPKTILELPGRTKSYTYVAEMVDMSNQRVGTLSPRRLASMDPRYYVIPTDSEPERIPPHRPVRVRGPLPIPQAAADENLDLRRLAMRSKEDIEAFRREIQTNINASLEVSRALIAAASMLEPPSDHGKFSNNRLQNTGKDRRQSVPPKSGRLLAIEKEMAMAEVAELQRRTSALEAILNDDFTDEHVELVSPGHDVTLPWSWDSASRSISKSPKSSARKNTSWEKDDDAKFSIGGIFARNQKQTTSRLASKKEIRIALDRDKQLLDASLFQQEPGSSGLNFIKPMESGLSPTFEEETLIAMKEAEERLDTSPHQEEPSSSDLPIPSELRIALKREQEYLYDYPYSVEPSHTGYTDEVAVESVSDPISDISLHRYRDLFTPSSRNGHDLEAYDPEEELRRERHEAFAYELWRREDEQKREAELNHEALPNTKPIKNDGFDPVAKTLPKWLDGIQDELHARHGDPAYNPWESPSDVAKLWRKHKDRDPLRPSDSLSQASDDTQDRRYT